MPTLVPSTYKYIEENSSESKNFETLRYNPFSAPLEPANPLPPKPDKILINVPKSTSLTQGQTWSKVNGQWKSKSKTGCIPPTYAIQVQYAKRTPRYAQCTLADPNISLRTLSLNTFCPELKSRLKTLT